MSWDVIFLKSKIDLEDPNLDLEPLGDKTEIINNLTSLLPDLDFSDRDWGMLSTEDFSIEFNIGNEETVDNLMLHIQGGGDPLGVIKAICDATNWGALDTQNTQFIDTDNISKESWEAFQAYRNKVIGK